MIKTVSAVAAAVSLLLAGTAFAQDRSSSDLLPSTPFAAKHFYLGGNVGANLDTSGNVSAGVTAGYEFNKYLRGELSYDYLWRSVPSDGSALMANAVVGYPIPNTKFTPYVLVGAGMGFGGMGTPTGSDGLWAVGGGVRYSATTNLELDARYKHLGHFSQYGMVNADALTLGVVYHF